MSTLDLEAIKRRITNATRLDAHSTELKDFVADFFERDVPALAAEVESLRARVEASREVCRAAVEAGDALRAEVARLERERDEALQLDGACSTLNEIAAASFEARVALSTLRAAAEKVVDAMGEYARETAVRELARLLDAPAEEEEDRE